jgi:hypothetical protein
MKHESLALGSCSKGQVCAHSAKHGIPQKYENIKAFLINEEVPKNQLIFEGLSQPQVLVLRMYKNPSYSYS